MSYTDYVSAQTAKKPKSACRKVAYCSTGCQMADWKARHKHECGKKLEVGEEFVLASLASRAELNGCRVVVERGMDAATGRVGVRIAYSQRATNDNYFLESGRPQQAHKKSLQCLHAHAFCR